MVLAGRSGMAGKAETSLLLLHLLSGLLGLIHITGIGFQEKSNLEGNSKKLTVIRIC